MGEVITTFMDKLEEEKLARLLEEDFEVATDMNDPDIMESLNATTHVEIAMDYLNSGLEHMSKYVPRAQRAQIIDMLYERAFAAMNADEANPYSVLINPDTDQDLGDWHD